MNRRYSESPAAQRKRAEAERRRARGYVGLGMWIPGDVHEHIVREANERGISMNQRIIQKLRA